jgi:phosphate transport system substrate-binding protein
MHACLKDKRVLVLSCLAIVLVILAGCQGEPKETPSKGYTTWMVSDEIVPLIQQEKDKFEELYTKAHIKLIPATDREAVSRLFNDTIKTAVLSRPLLADEQSAARQAKLDLSEYKVAIDAIAIIVNNKNPIDQLRTTELDSILTGTVTNWKEVGGKTGSIHVCLPTRNLGDYEVMSNELLHGAKFGQPARIADSAAEMLRFVIDDPDAIGMVGMNRYDAKRDSVKVLALADPNAPDSLGIRGRYFKPFQAHIYRRYYPLTRDIVIYSRADEYGVTAGFITFIANIDGQKIVLNSGLVPATMPVRLVELTNKGITQ